MKIAKLCQYCARECQYDLHVKAIAVKAIFMSRVTPLDINKHKIILIMKFGKFRQPVTRYVISVLKKIMYI